MRATRFRTLAALAITTILVGSALLHSARGAGEVIERQRSAVDAGGSAAESKALAAAAVDEDATAAKAAIARLREMGPQGLKVLFDANADLIARHSGAPVATGDAADAAQWARVSGAIDAVAAQKDAYTSGLYWYTDLDAAKAAAKASGRPILSLRLLGTLDSEYSCANSRYFRTVLYANKEVSKALAENFVLHWKSVRPVPKITIDFGDGRVVERTITGNSIHYVLDADGNVIDGIPGLYGPRAFLQHAEEAAALVRQLPQGPERAAAIRRWHSVWAGKDLDDWQADLQRVGAAPATAQAVTINSAMVKTVGTPQVAGQPAIPPTALAAGRRAIGKGMVETPMVRALAQHAPGEPALLETASTDAVWAKIAALHADDARLDAGSKALMAAKNPSAMEAGRLAVSKTRVESPMLRLVRSFERSIAEDTVRNEYTFHRQIHQWLADGATSDGKPISGLDALNDRVYAQLFLTPSSDPWLGLVPPDTYTALPDEGICKK
jgi:hypothetical protein